MRFLIHTIENLIKKGERKEKIFSSPLGEDFYEKAKEWIPLTKEEKLKIAKEHQVEIKNFD
jgi:Trm5-related predicted tRNA methylase